MKDLEFNRGLFYLNFWDIHELIDDYTIDKMFSLHKKRYPYTHDKINLKNGFIRFQNANDDFEPGCLRGKHWELIKLDIVDFLREA